MNRKTKCPPALLSFIAAFLLPHGSGAQVSPSTAPESSETPITLSPFIVLGDDQGYVASTTLAGTRLRTELSDIGTAVTVLTKEFLDDLGATDNQSALSYATNTEVYGVTGNFQNTPIGATQGQPSEVGAHFAPNSQTRVRGLTNADNALNYFRTNVAWEGYNVSRIDLLRGPNSILFGLGSPGGVVNASTETANLTLNTGEVRVETDEFGSFRSSINYNKVIAEDQLAIRLALLKSDKKFKQDPAYDDQERLFLTAKYRPKFLNRNGMSFEVIADYQRGTGESNRPRTNPPTDQVTPWIEPVTIQAIPLRPGSVFSGTTYGVNWSFPDGIIPAYTQFADQSGVTYFQNVGGQPGYNTAALGGSSDALGARLTVNSAGSSEFWRAGRVWTTGVLLANGTQWAGNPQANRRLFGHGNRFQDRHVRAVTSFVGQFGQKHPLGPFFNAFQLSDPSVFNFYDKLLDGPNKREWNDFDQLRLVVSNSFFNQKIGYEASFFREDVTRGQTTLLSDSSRIYVDTLLEDIEGNPNPDFGRPFVSETSFGGNRRLQSEIDAYRFSAYLDHDFRENDRSSWWRNLAGRHVFNGALTGERSKTDNRVFSRHTIGPEFIEQTAFYGMNDNQVRPGVRYYLGDSLAGRDSIAGANFTNIEEYIIPAGGTINYRYFDTTWNAPSSVLPNARWVTPTGQNWEQAANPANYVGWTNADFSIVDALSGDQADFDYATRQANLLRNDVDSKILSWQGYLLNDIVVATAGWREDESRSDSFRTLPNPKPYNNANLSDYSLENPGAIRDDLKVRSNSYSGVAHLHRIPGLRDRLPLNVSLSYNRGENFNPTSGRRDSLGNFLPSPQGATEEFGVLFGTKDNKYSLRVMRYETAVLNSTSQQIAQSSYQLAQFLGQNPRQIINDIESGDARADYEAEVIQPDWSIDDQENIHAPAWRQFERDFAAAFPGFIDSWLTQGSWAPSNSVTEFSTPFVTTEDNLSKGWEVELTANPSRSLRLAINASKTNAERTNVPGPSTASIYEFLQNAMYNSDGTRTAAGGMRSGFNTVEDTMADVWTVGNYTHYLGIQQLNGQPAPELVEYRANALANYTFHEGRLQGWAVGGAMRYEGESTIGFPIYFVDNGLPTSSATIDLENPFRRPANDRYDLWLSYRKQLFDDKVAWSIQLNVFNLFGDDELLPVRANPDGTVANFRIQQGRSWKLSSTFRF
ncbi:MAG: hypothetical protein O2960_24470 [Verrucomicrobia bacterium]|nr:hypothetical protein [Verrucomicrobiota bacterium]